MTNHMRSIGPELLAYLRQHSLKEAPELAGLRAATAEMPESGWASAPEQSQLLAFMAGLISARTILEVGTFTGYTTLALAMTLPENGKLVTCDMMTEYTDIGEPFWAKAGVRDKIDLRIGPAVKVLDDLIGEVGDDYFDMAFIDANKKNYGDYYERALKMVRPGGLIAFDNMLWAGRVLDANDSQKSTVAIRALNEKLFGDERIQMVMLPLDDGLTLARKV